MIDRCHNENCCGAISGLDMTGCPHIDLTDPQSYIGGMPREAFRYLRNEQPIYWHEDPAQGVGFWAVTRQKDLDFISKNPLLFCNRSVVPVRGGSQGLPNGD